MINVSYTSTGPSIKHVVQRVISKAGNPEARQSTTCIDPLGAGIFQYTTLITQSSYQRGDRSFFYWIDTYSVPGQYERAYNRPLSEASIQQVFLSHFASQLSDLHPGLCPLRFSDEEVDKVFSGMELGDALDFFTSKCSLGFHRRYPGNHINWWSAGKMAMMLEEAGFDTVYRSGYGQSAAPPLRNLGHFDRTHPKISLFMEAVKS